MIYFIPFFFVASLNSIGNMVGNIFCDSESWYGNNSDPCYCRATFWSWARGQGGARGILGRVLLGIGGGIIALPASALLGIGFGPLTLLILGVMVSILGILLSYNAVKSESLPSMTAGV